MIYTVTLNPSIDYVASTTEFATGKLNRISEEVFLPGGKGNNVSIVLKNLGVESTALGFIAGFTGDAIDRMLSGQGIRTDFIKLSEGNSRINMKINSVSDCEETEINGCGPKICPEDIVILKKKLDKLAEGDTVVLAGSIPPSVPNTIYEEICKQLEGKGVRMIVDAEKKLLENVLGYHPFLVKPNHHELGQLYETHIRTKEDALFYAKKMQQAGAQNIIVSMAGEGAVFLGADGETWQMEAPIGETVNSVGAGDSMIAGFLAAIEQGKTMETAFCQSVFCGSACAFLKGLPTAADIEKIKTESENI